jgi:hypothetical protein
MRKIIIILVLLTGIIIYTNPSLEDGKQSYVSKFTNVIFNKLTGGILGVSICREDHIFYSTFYATANVTGFGVTATLQGCVPQFYGFCGMFFDVSEETKVKYEKMYIGVGDNLADCPGDCEPEE